MELVGRALKREIKGRGVLSGTVKSYESSSGLFKVLYEDGDSEDLGWAEVSSLVGAQAQLAEDDGEVKPKKRRRLEGGEGECDSGNAAQNFVIESDLNDGGEGNLEMQNGVGGNLVVNGGLNGRVDSRNGFGETLGGKREEGLEGNGVSGNGNLRDGFDLNAGFNLNLNDDDSSLDFDHGEKSKKRDRIDLNLDVNGDFDESLSVGDFIRSPVGTRRKACNFDLNLEVVDDVKEVECEGGGEFKGSGSIEALGDGQTKEGDDVKIVEDIGSNGTLTKVHLDINEDINVSFNSVKDVCIGSAELVKNDCSGSYQDGKPDVLVVGLDADPVAVRDCDLTEVHVRDGYSEAGLQMINEHISNSGSPVNKKGGRRKRRKQSDIVKSPAETVLRRSARRGSAQNHVSITSCTVNDIPSSPAVSAITEEKPGSSVRKEPDKPCVLVPPKLQLPPSSQNIDLNDIPILDLFSVYSCLRSFSTLLFLSPFELEDFVAAVKCKSPSSLFDNIHVSILQTLRKHLVYLSNEGSESASDCLRYSLNLSLINFVGLFSYLPCFFFFLLLLNLVYDFFV